MGIWFLVFQPQKNTDDLNIIGIYETREACEARMIYPGYVCLEGK